MSPAPKTGHIIRFRHGIALALTTAERYPWINICVTSGQSATRPEVLPLKVRFISKPWRAAEVLAFMEGA